MYGYVFLTVQATDGVDTDVSVSSGEDVHDLLENVRARQEPPNVIKARDSFEREVWDDSGDCFSLRAILLISWGGGRGCTVFTPRC